MKVCQHAGLPRTCASTPGVAGGEPDVDTGTVVGERFDVLPHADRGAGRERVDHDPREVLPGDFDVVVGDVELVHRHLADLLAVGVDEHAQFGRANTVLLDLGE